LIRVEFSAEFKHALQRLSKKYRRIRADLQPIFDQLVAGATPGDRVQGVGAKVYKVRAANRDAGSGKSGGYRVLYYVQTEDLRVMLTVYAKTERADIAADELKAILRGLRQS
jgi:mRNA-degrading endonuclease RelE of RelBE toxin-antitoxin system